MIKDFIALWKIYQIIRKGEYDIVQLTKTADDVKDVTLVIETCTDGVSWSPTLPISQTAEPSPASPDLQRVTYAFIAEPKRCFFRLLTTSLPP